ncbi:hypothetical protein NIES4071_105710 (plasmid) [Calothrix sp. NIES-4071]|nr:hypothetical protein NIES4071_105710 [Calothrix sp. NIES-4071]BAZ64989.1 hypothetical protein NIES4105_107220 [Calothrix sp. NIES-4105]
MRRQRDTTKVVYPTAQSLPQKTTAPSVTKQIPSAQKFAANIRSSIGCGAVNEEYKTKVVAVAVAQTNQKATEKLTEPQFYQAVRQSIKENQAQANNLVAEFRASNCAQARSTPGKLVAPLVSLKFKI